MPPRLLAAVVSTWCLAGIATLAQAPPRLPPIDSPVVHADRTVTFSLRAPNATRVELSGQCVKGPQPMVKDADGVWRVTLGFYLVSGTTDTEETWSKVGRVHVILDNLIAEKRAVPMIVVMPYGNMRMGTPDPSSVQVAEMYKAFADDLVGSVIPWVEANYRVKPRREQRAIAGFSRGGGQSLFTGFSHLDTFAWIGSYAAYLSPEVMDTHFAGLLAQPAATNARLELLWLGVGREDCLYKPAVAFDELLTARQIVHTSLVTGGGHTWMNARHYLAETLQRFFT